MAINNKILNNNNKGQALIESIFILPLTMLFLIYVIQVILYLTVEFAIDDAMENYILCEVQGLQTCESSFKKNITFLPLKKVHYSFEKNKNIYTVKLNSTVLEIFKIKKIRELDYVTKI